MEDEPVNVAENDNVVPLNEWATLPPDATKQKDIIELLERYLSKARAGELTGIAIVGVERNTAPTSTWTHCGTPNGYVLMAGVTGLSYRMVKTTFDD